MSGVGDPGVAPAPEIGLSPWTVRSLLDAVFAKTGTPRQPDLGNVLLFAEKL